jgi:hypothetical protein
MSSTIALWLGIVAATASSVLPTLTVVESAGWIMSGSAARVAIAAEPKSAVDELIAGVAAKEKKGDYQGILTDMDRAIAIALNSTDSQSHYLRGIMMFGEH